jgi:glycosyltransferase involved in cell wall biosynthesis
MSPKVCVISREFPPESAFGGIARAADMEARALARAGADVHVITFSPRGAFQRYVDEGIVVHRLGADDLHVLPDMQYVVAGAWSHRVARYYAGLDALVGFHVVVGQDYFAETLHLVRRPETSLVVRLHSLSAVVSERSGRARSGGERALEALEQTALQEADLLLAPTALVLDETRRLLGDRTPPARLLPLAFDSARFAPAGQRPAGDAPLRLLFLGRIEPLKRPELALHAAAAVKRAGRRVRLTLVGRDIDGYRHRTLVPLMGELGLSFADVRFVEQVDEDGVRQHIHASDCAVLPSWFENFHMAAVEALACGVPVITGDRNGLCHWVDAADGLVALPAGDAERFGSLAAEALADRTALRASGDRGRARVQELFDPAVVATGQLDAFADLGAPRPGAAERPEPIAWAPRLGVVVLAYNALEYTKRCLRSVLAHTPVDLTVYLVDNASTDATPEWVASLDPRVKLLRSEINLGVSGGRNVGIAAAQADGVDYIAFLDNDVEVFPGWWEPFVAALEADPEAGIAGEAGVDLEFGRSGRTERGVAGPGPVPTDMVVGYCMVMTAAAVRHIGRFDEELGLFWHDDDDYCLRAKWLGYRVLHIGSGRLVHFEHKSSSEVDGIWDAVAVSKPSAMSARNQRYLTAKWRRFHEGESGIEGARSFVALALADELLADSALLSAWGAAFDGDDDATLVIYGAGPDEAVQERLEELVVGLGLADDDAADLALVFGPVEVDPAIAASVDVVLSHAEPARALHAPPRFGADDLAEVRALASRRWVALEREPELVA